MPRPTDITTQKAPADAPFGAEARLQRLAQSAPTTLEESAPPAPQGESRDPSMPPPLAGDLNDGYDDYLFAETSRPAEPLTHGSPFGAGANFVPRPQETPRSFMLRVAGDLERAPGAGPEVQKLIARIRAGE